MDTLPVFRRTVFDAGLEDVVIAAVGLSPRVAAVWATPLALLLHRRRPRRRAGPGRLRRLDAARRARAAPSPSTTCSPTRPTAAVRPTRRSTSPPWPRGRFEERRAVGSLRILTRTA